MTATRSAPALSTGSWSGPVIDADVHIAVPGIEALLPHLADFWIEYVHESNFNAPPSLAQVYPPGAPTSCRPEWRAPDGLLDAVPESAHPAIMAGNARAHFRGL